MSKFEDAGLFIQQGNEHMRRKEAKEAIETYRKALLADPENEKNNELLGDAHRITGDIY